MVDDSALKRLVEISNPRMWFFYPAMYVLGVAMGISSLKDTTFDASVWLFILYIVWFISLGMIAGFVGSEKKHSIVFPSDLIRAVVGHAQRASGDFVSSYTSGFCFLFFLIINTISQDGNVLILSSSFFLLDFLLHFSSTINIVKVYARVLYGMVLVVPCVMGYFFVTHMLPSTDCVVAGILYGIAMGIYGNVVEREYTLFSKNTALLVSGMLSIVCGSILARYGAIFFATVSSLLAVLGMSFFAKNNDEMHAIHTKAFYLHLIVGVAIGTYFFAH